jgi:hypothetical protein
VTEASRSHFESSILPYVERLAAGRGRGIADPHDREDAEAELVARAWEHYVELARLEPEPALCRVLCALYRPEPVWTYRPEPEVRILSMGNPRVRAMAEAVPA